MPTRHPRSTHRTPRPSALVLATQAGHELADRVTLPLETLLNEEGERFAALIRQHLRETGTRPANETAVFRLIDALPERDRATFRRVFADYSNDRNGEESASADVAFAIGVAYGSRLAGGRR